MKQIVRALCILSLYINSNQAMEIIIPDKKTLCEILQQNDFHDLCDEKNMLFQLSGIAMSPLGIHDSAILTIYHCKKDKKDRDLWQRRYELIKILLQDNQEALEELKKRGCFKE